jgi:hypothetical protein
MFGTDAQSAVPALMQLTNLSGGYTTSSFIGHYLEACNALRKINPLAASPSSDTFSDFGFPTVDPLLPPR